jgi:hypothetical protein
MNLREVLKTLIIRFQKQDIDFALSGGLALSTMGIFRFTKDIDFLVYEDSKSAVHGVMTELGYEKQEFSTDEIISYVSPLKVFGQVDRRAPRKPRPEGWGRGELSQSGKLPFREALPGRAGRLHFLLARRKYTRAMMSRSKKMPIFEGEFEVKTLLPEDLIGLKVQAISNDPQNRYLVDAPDIQRLLAMQQNKMDMDLVREYFRLFGKEELLDEWISAVE